MSDTQGYDVTLTVAVDRPGDPDVDQATLSDTTAYLSKFDLKIADFATLTSGVLTLYAADTVSAGLTFTVTAIADDWQVSQVTGAALPGVVGTPVTVGPLGALAAGDPITADLSAIAGDAQDGTNTWLGVRVDVTAGGPATIWSFNAVDPALRPSWDTVYEFTAPTPTNLSPRTGKVVAGAQIPLRVLDYAVDLDDIALTSMNVQWSTDGTEANIVADNTQTVTAPTFDMTAATSRHTLADGHTTSGAAAISSATARFTPDDVGATISGTNIPALTTILGYVSPTQVTMSANATGTATTTVFTIGRGVRLGSTGLAWRTRLKGAGPWSPWSPWQTGITYAANPSLSITYPAAGNTVTDTDPIDEWSFGGTQTAYMLTRAALDDPTTILNPLSAGKLPSTVSAASAGYEVLGYDSVTDTLRVWDDKDREDIPGFPGYSEASVTWSVGDDATLHPPDNVEVRLLDGDSPFVVVTWTHTKLQDFRVRRRLGTDTPNSGKNISGLLSGQAILTGIDEGVYSYQWIDLTSRPGETYVYRPQVVTDHRGSAGGDAVAITAGESGAFVTNQTSGDWVRFKNFDAGTWRRTSPNTVVYAAVKASAKWRRSRGNRMGYSAPMSGEFWPSLDATVAQMQRAWERMGNTDDQLTLVTPHEVVPIFFTEDASSPMDHFYLPRRVEFTAYQNGLSSLTGIEGDGGQLTISGFDYEEGTNGAALTTASPGVAFVSGSPKFETHGTLHDQTMVATSGTGGTWSRLLPNNRAAGSDSYLELTLPSSGKSVFTKLQDVLGDDLFSLRVGDDGKISLFDNTGGPVLMKTTKLYTAGDILRVSRVCSNDGATTSVEYHLFYGSSIDTAVYSEVLSGSVADTVGPFRSVVGNAGGEIVVREYEGRLVNAPVFLDSEFMDTALPTFNFLLPGVPQGGSAVVSTVLDVVDDGFPGAPGDLVKMAVSSSPDMSSPTLSSSQAVSSLSIVKNTVTGLTGGLTRYYCQPALPDGTLFGEVGGLCTPPANSGAWSMRLAPISCQDNGSESAGATLVYGDVLDFDPHMVLPLGDSGGYWGGSIAGTDPPSKDIGKYRKAHAAKPTMRAVWQYAPNVHCISDHELYDNSDYNNASNPNGGQYGTPGAGIHDSPMSIRQLIAWEGLLPVATWGDVRTPKRHRGYVVDLGSTVRLIVTDFRTPDRSNIPDTDGAAKQMWGAVQHAWIKAQHDANRVNLIISEANWYADPAGATVQTDKPWSYRYWQQDYADFVTASGAYSGGTVYNVGWIGGDRHFVGFLDGASNPLGGFPVWISSGVYKNSLQMLLGETMTWQVGGGRDLDPDDDVKVPVCGWMKMVLADDGAGNITLTGTGRAVSDADISDPESSWTLTDYGPGVGSWSL